MKNISIKGLLLSGIGYYAISTIVALFAMPYIISMAATDCNTSLVSEACLSIMNKEFGIVFFGTLIISAIATYISLTILVSYSLPNLKINYLIYLVINSSILTIALNDQLSYEFIVHLIVTFTIIGLSYKYETNDLKVNNTTINA